MYIKAGDAPQCSLSKNQQNYTKLIFNIVQGRLGRKNYQKGVDLVE